MESTGNESFDNNKANNLKVTHKYYQEKNQDTDPKHENNHAPMEYPDPCLNSQENFEELTIRTSLIQLDEKYLNLEEYYPTVNGKIHKEFKNTSPDCKRRKVMPKIVPTINFMQANVRTFKQNQIEIEEITKTENIDILFLQETGFNKVTYIDNYTTITKQRKISKKGIDHLPTGGGLITAIKKNKGFTYRQCDIDLGSDLYTEYILTII